MAVNARSIAEPLAAEPAAGTRAFDDSKNLIFAHNQQLFNNGLIFVFHNLLQSLTRKLEA
jgi:hypothetical protein